MLIAKRLAIERRLLAGGYDSFGQIGREFGVSPASVRHVANRFGIKGRDRITALAQLRNVVMAQQALLRFRKSLPLMCRLYAKAIKVKG